MRKAALVVAGSLAGLLLLMAFLPRAVSLEKFRPRLSAALEERTGRRVALSKLSLALLPVPGVRVHGLSISGDPGHEAEPMVEAPEAELRLAILPLLSGRAEFSRLVLLHPAIVVRRFADGTTSLSETIRRASLPASPAQPGAATFPLGMLDVRDARVSLRLEESQGREEAWDATQVSARIGGLGGGRYEFDVSGTARGRVRGHLWLAGQVEREPGPAGVYRVKASGDLFRQDVAVEGKVSAAGVSPELELTVSMPRIRMGDLREILPRPVEAAERARLQGFASLSAKVSGTPDALGFEIEADLGKAGWTVRGGLQKFIDMPCTLVAQGRRFPDQLILSNAELRFPPLLVIANLSFVPSSGRVDWSASSRIDSLAEFAKSRGELLQGWGLSGRVTASGTGGRPARGAEPAWSVGIDLGEVGFREPGSPLEFRGLDGHLVLTHEALEFAPMVGLLNGQGFSVRGTLARGDHPAGPLALSMDYLDLDALFPDGGHGRTGQSKNDGGAEPAAATGPIAFLADLSIGAGRASGIDFRGLTGKVRLEKGIHSFEGLHAELLGGELSATGHIDTAGRNPDFRAKVLLKGVDVSALLARRTSLGDYLSGAVTMTLDVGGGIRDFAEFARTATGEGTVVLTGGRLAGFDLVGQAGRLAGLSSAVPPSTPPETALSKLSADFRIGGGRIRTDALRIDSGGYELAGPASFGFDRTVDFVGVLRLPRGRTTIPLVVSGGLRAPAVAIDSRVRNQSETERKP
jgi:hypothetical protein